MAILLKLGCLCGTQVHPATMIEYPNTTRKPPKSFYIIRYHWGPGTVLLDIPHSITPGGGGREEEKYSQRFPPIAPGVPCLLLGSS